MSEPTGQKPQQPGLLARLKGIFQPSGPETADTEEECAAPDLDGRGVEAPSEQPETVEQTEAPLSEEVVAAGQAPSETEARPAEEGPAEMQEADQQTAVPESPAEQAEGPPAEVGAGLPRPYDDTVDRAAAPVDEALPPCPLCQATRTPGQPYCGDCGYFFPADTPAPAARPAADPAGGPSMRIKQRYELGELLGERGGVSRFRGRDLGLGGDDTLPVVIARQQAQVVAEVPAAPLDASMPACGHPGMPAGAEPVVEEDEEILPGFDLPAAEAVPITQELPPRPDWPGVAWERELLDLAEHPGLPAVRDSFSEDGFDYLVVELPSGRSLWDCWDDPDSTSPQRFAWLAQVAEALQALHRAGAILEGLRPDIVVIDQQGQARLTDVGDLLPLPPPPDAPVRGQLYTAPELLSAPQTADARADLYGFGAMLYALHLGRELSDRDFIGPGSPRPIFNDFPDLHPAFGRLLLKTFNRQVEARFPTDEAMREDPTGFTELVRNLEVCGRALDAVRLEVAAWTTTGMVRTGNEDAFALLHACESRQDDTADAALVLLADGMGGYEAGEVAAAMAIQSLRKSLTALKPFNTVAGASAFPTDLPRPEGNAPPPLDVEQAKQMVKAALKDANKYVFSASRAGAGRRGMGCTAEAVYIDGRNVIVGHVGDSRTYHLSEGRLIQVTRDQTLVGRLVELGTLTPEEAENHPRKNELQQAVGGQPDVEPGIYHSVLKPGDFVVVCSDGLTNHVKDLVLKQFLQSEATSAEMAARRLVNLANIEGATDNATVVVVRAT